jgi:hypothetical protein
LAGFELHTSIKDIEMPERIAMLPRSARGFPVPWFVAWVDGEPDFRVIKPEGIEEAVKHGTCWICGYSLGMTATYVSGPMCGINRTTSEPPSHHACADYAAEACPFLSRPDARRRDAGLPEEAHAAPGTPIDRNPGVVMLWRGPSLPLPFTPHTGGTLYHLPDPARVDWIAEGRKATRDEVIASVESGIPLLRDAAAAEGPEALKALHEQVKAFYYVLPAASSVP